MPESKTELYERLVSQVNALLADEPDRTARAANFCSVLFYELPDLNWCGFYWLQEDELVVGPFQGKLACFRIPLTRGVCGAAASDRRTFVVPNVHDFPGHIACDCASNSECVVPVVSDEGELLGVLDLDSPTIGRFDEEDARGLESLVEAFLESEP